MDTIKFGYGLIYIGEARDDFAHMGKLTTISALTDIISSLNEGVGLCLSAIIWLDEDEVFTDEDLDEVLGLVDSSLYLESLEEFDGDAPEFEWFMSFSNELNLCTALLQEAVSMRAQEDTKGFAKNLADACKRIETLLRKTSVLEDMQV